MQRDVGLREERCARGLGAHPCFLDELHTSRAVRDRPGCSREVKRTLPSSFFSFSPFPAPSCFFASSLRPWRKGVESSRVAGRGRTTQDSRPSEAQPLGWNAETETDRTSRHLQQSQCLFFFPFFPFFSHFFKSCSEALTEEAGSQSHSPFCWLF